VRFLAEGLGCRPALVLAVFGVADAALGAALAGLRAGRVLDGGTPSAGVGGCDFRMSLILGAPYGVMSEGDIVIGMLPPGVTAECVDAEIEEVPRPLILRVRRFAGCGGGGGG